MAGSEEMERTMHKLGYAQGMSDASQTSAQEAFDEGFVSRLSLFASYGESVGILSALDMLGNRGNIEWSRMQATSNALKGRIRDGGQDVVVEVNGLLTGLYGELQRIGTVNGIPLHPDACVEPTKVYSVISVRRRAGKSQNNDNE